MSRIGKKPIDLPSGTTIEIKDSLVTVKGPKGELSREIRPETYIEIEGNVVNVKRKGDSKHERAFHGLTRTLVSNMVEGVSKGFTRSLELIGVGYRCIKQGQKLVLQVGYSHPVEFDPPSGIEFVTEGATKLHIKGIDKQLVGDMAAKIRAVRKPEPYKGKGIKYSDEVIRRKAGKSGK